MGEYKLTPEQEEQFRLGRLLVIQRQGIITFEEVEETSLERYERKHQWRLPYNENGWKKMYERMKEDGD